MGDEFLQGHDSPKLVMTFFAVLIRQFYFLVEDFKKVKYIGLSMNREQNQTKHAKLLLVGWENRCIFSEPTIAARPNEPEESNGYASGGPID